MVWNRYSASDSSPQISLNLLSWTFTINAFLRRQMEQSQVVSSGKSVSISKRTAPQWQLPRYCRVGRWPMDGSDLSVEHHARLRRKTCSARSPGTYFSHS